MIAQVAGAARKPPARFLAARGRRALNSVKRMFGDAPSALATLVAAGILLGLVIPFVRWAILDANFVGTSPASCTHVGACWVFIADKFGLLVYGFYPRAVQWQVDLSVVVITLGCGGAILLAGRYQVVTACALLWPPWSSASYCSRAACPQ